MWVQKSFRANLTWIDFMEPNNTSRSKAIFIMLVFTLGLKFPFNCAGFYLTVVRADTSLQDRHSYPAHTACLTLLNSILKATTGSTPVPTLPNPENISVWREPPLPHSKIPQDNWSAKLGLPALPLCPPLLLRAAASFSHPGISLSAKRKSASISIQLYMV